MELLRTGYYRLPTVAKLADFGSVDPVIKVTTILVCFGAWLWWYRWSQRHTLGAISWPLVGSLPEGWHHWDNLHDHVTPYFYKAHTHLVEMGFGFQVLFTVDPANVEHIMKTNFANYPKGPRITAINSDFFGQGLFNSDGDSWVHQRKVAAMEFATSRLRSFSTPIFREYALRLAARIVEKSASRSQFDLQDLMSRMTLDTTVRIAFGVDLGCLAPALPVLPFAKSFETASVCSFFRFLHPFWKLERFLQIGQERQMKRAVETLDSFSYDVIQRRKNELDGKLMAQVNEEKDDLLSRFVKMRKQGDDRFSDRALRDITVNYIMAGRDSTSSAICWTLYMLICHPEALLKVRTELATLVRRQQHSPPGLHASEEEAFRAFAELLTFENVGSLTYLHAVVTETLRLFPPVPMNAKEAVADDIMPDGTKVKGGNIVAFHAYGMGRMPYIWGPDASDFKPERWIKDGVFRPESNFKYIVFQGGPRLCLGKDSSYLHIKITVALLMQFFDFHLVPGHRVHYKTMFSLVMADGLKVTVSKRNTDSCCDRVNSR